MWFYYLDPVFDIVEVFLGVLMLSVFIFAFLDLIYRTILFQKLGIGGFFAALIPVITDFTLFRAYIRLLTLKGMLKNWHRIIPVLHLVCSISFVITGSLLGVGGFGTPILRPSGKGDLSAFYLINNMAFLVRGFLYFWTAFVTCSLEETSKKKAIFYMFFPSFRAFYLNNVASEYEKVAVSK